MSSRPCEPRPSSRNGCGSVVSVVLATTAFLVAAPAFASEAGAHTDPVANLVLALAVILIAAKLGGDLAVRVGQPAVLGELLVGVLLGNLALAGAPGIEQIKSDPFVDMIARLGVLILLFEVGLESTVAQMLKVGSGLILEDLHYRDFVDRGEHGLEELIVPISSFVVPVSSC